jgi:intraflagellar transport protein 140
LTVQEFVTLNKPWFLQTCGEWEKAVEVATQYDRVNLRNTHHAYAKYLEGVGKIKEAIHHYELSGTHR